MASLAAYSYKKQMKIAHTSRVLDLKGWERIPPPFMVAMQNALNCEIKTAKTLSKQIKQEEQKKGRTNRISFGNVKEHSGNKIKEKKICFETKPKEMISCFLMDP